MPHARRHVRQLQTSALQPSLDKLYAGIRKKVVPSLSWFGVVTKMAFGLVETDMGAICCRQLCTAITTVLEQSKEVLIRSALHDLKQLYNWI